MARQMKMTGYTTLLIVVVLLAQNASALLTSSYYDGSVPYETEEGLSGRLYFAVYDTADAGQGDELVANKIDVEELPGTGQYIYAYQIYSSFFSAGDISHFGILDAGGNAINESLINGTSAQDDGTEGIAPSPIVSEHQGQWEWTFDGGYIAQGEHSWLLVFSSDKDWTAGTYEITGPGTPVPVPEPATLALLGLGMTALMTKRRKTVQ